MTNQRYPLDWPAGYARNALSASYRSKPMFKTVSLTVAVDLVEGEVRKLLGKNRLGETDLVISTNVPLRNDGYPRADYLKSVLRDPGAAIYFNYNREPVVLCCDKWAKIEDNLKAIAVTIEDMRRIERNGVSDFIKRSFSGFKALPAGPVWWSTLGLTAQPSTYSEAMAAYKRLSMTHHPDKGGTVDAMAALNDAIDQARKFYLGKTTT